MTKRYLNGRFNKKVHQRTNIERRKDWVINSILRALSHEITAASCLLDIGSDGTLPGNIDVLGSDHLKIPVDMGKNEKEQVKASRSNKKKISFALMRMSN